MKVTVYTNEPGARLVVHEGFYVQVSNDHTGNLDVKVFNENIDFAQEIASYHHDVWRRFVVTDITPEAQLKATHKAEQNDAARDHGNPFEGLFHGQ